MSIHPAECREVVIHATETMSCNTWVGILWHKCTDLRTNRRQKPHWFVQAWISWPESCWKLTVKFIKRQNIRGQLCPTWLNIPVPHYIYWSIKKMLTLWKVILYLLFFVQNCYIVALRKLATSESCCSQTMIIHMLITPAFR